MISQSAQIRPFLLACLLTAGASCGNSGIEPASSGVGGSTNTGGTSNSVSGGSSGQGGNSASTGGVSALSSKSSASTGGKSSTGASTTQASTGGKSSTGGATAGGRSSTGGTSLASIGGKSSAGGTSTAGGTAATTGGVTSAVGGKSSTTSKTSSGGSGTGGAATGGAAAGGKSSTGGATGGGGATGACANVQPLATSTCTSGDSNCFSFFVASRARMFALAQSFNGSTKGWGGDFRYGTGDGLTGADKLCTQIAEQSLPGNCRNWKAFLSTSTVNAISRVGAGPWYDRLNRMIAHDVTELTATRPGGITNSTILNNLPNEDGTPHHNEEASCTNLDSCADNHDVITGSDSDGKVCTSSSCGGGMGMGGGNITDFTCKDWTLGTSQSGIAPRVGHTWPTGGGGGMMNDWISVLTEGGCAPGYNLVQTGGPTSSGTGTVGEGGGYGGIYCLAAE